MSTMPTKEAARSADAPNIPEPQTGALATRPAWHRPTLTRIDIKATLEGASAGADTFTTTTTG